MRKSVLLFSVFLFVLLLSSCGIQANPIEDPDIEKFEELYVDDDFSVFIKSEEYRAGMYTMEAYGFGYNDDICTVGSYERTNYMFYYKDKYYDIVEFNKFRLIECDDLSEIGIIGLNGE